ncbi:unnamed protein product [Acanthosepion pharaonis]|uniref:Uncharacterized protein n=1 Tax=Acanthosepion pharaonis TaxID=158019 RepID=A0A812C4D3_ACAPH|nr:unnamed protein product [Sepia pharaonis]
MSAHFLLGHSSFVRLHLCVEFIVSYSLIFLILSFFPSSLQFDFYFLIFSIFLLPFFQFVFYCSLFSNLFSSQAFDHTFFVFSLYFLSYYLSFVGNSPCFTPSLCISFPSVTFRFLLSRCPSILRVSLYFFHLISLSLSLMDSLYQSFCLQIFVSLCSPFFLSIFLYSIFPHLSLSLRSLLFYHSPTISPSYSLPRALFFLLRLTLFLPTPRT